MKLRTLISLLLCGMLVLSGCSKSADSTPDSGSGTAAGTDVTPTQTDDPSAGESEQSTDDPEQPTEPVENNNEDSEQPDQSFEAELYLPNENADGFDIVTAEFNETDVETPQLLIDLLIENGALPEGCTVNSFDMTKSIPPQLRLDLNSVYGEAVSRSGTAGEAMYLGSVVNTFLTYYDAEKIVFTVDGQPLETGHNVYDEPLGFFR